MVEKEDLTGRKFNRLTVLGRDVERNKLEKERMKCGEIKCARSYFICECECKNIKTISSTSLKNELTKSCGCLAYEVSKKYNIYDLTGEYGIGYDCKGLDFYFDLEDYELIKDYSWNRRDDKCKGYVSAYNRNTKKTMLLHQLINGKTNNTFIDHINRKPYDCRKENLREVTQQQNNMNTSLRVNSSGVTGVCWDKTNKLWRVYIGLNGKLINLKSFKFEDKEKAIITRLKKEKELYGDFASQKHLYKQYGIEE